VNQGDICQQEVDVITNPANEYLTNGGGAAKAISDEGGP
jgi:O-acetyl-ADP-ribose deacetylase (regulator of RNase III)